MQDNPHTPANSASLRTLRGFAAEEGGAIPLDGRAAFTLLRPSTGCIPILISVPHAGRRYPPEVLQRMRQAETTTLMLEDRYSDRLGEEIAQATGATLLIAEAPRALIDLNRAPQDIDWNMIDRGPSRQAVPSGTTSRARGGLGLIPRKLARVGEIWTDKTSQDELEQRISGIHSPYHTTVQQVLSEMRAEWGVALLIDLHSMPPIGRQASHVPAAQLVLGDRFGAACATALSSAALQWLQQARTAAHNLPYAGGYVLERHGKPASGVHALQLEVCRSLYLDGEMRELNARFATIGRELAAFVKNMAAELRWLADPLPQAAE